MDRSLQLLASQVHVPYDPWSLLLLMLRPATKLVAGATKLVGGITKTWAFFTHDLIRVAAFGSVSLVSPVAVTKTFEQAYMG